MEFGCIGEKLSHSFSKEIHKKIADYQYELRELEREKVPDFIKGKNYKAINVTIPYKEVVIPFLDHVSKEALAIGSVNTIVNKDGVLYGYNTDFLGMKKLIEENGIEIKGKKVVILGTGGTSKTAFALSKHLLAKEIIKVSREKKEDSITYETLYEKHKDAQVIINTTPVGMYPNSENKPVDIKDFGALEAVIDAIYNPLRTNLVSEALERGIKGVGGLYMLVAQGVLASEKFLDTAYEVDAVSKVFKEIVKEKENVVLTGMPGAGKSTIGKILADKLNKTFIDTDEEIKKTGKSPEEIINTLGEEKFRDIESQIIKEVSSLNNCIIATGGGAVLRKENIKALKRNGKIVFLNRDIKDICPTSDRPLSMDRAALEKRFEERFDIYMNTSDVSLKIGNDAICNAEKIIKELWK